MGLRYSPIVLCALLYVVVCLMLEALLVRGRSEARLCAEVLALRHQLGVLERQLGRPRWQPTDRLVLAAISRVLPGPEWRSLMPRPETLLRWHRELVRRMWAAYRRRPRRRRPNARSELHDLILQLARENEGWGYRLLRDRDTKFTVAFDEVFKSEGVEVIRLPFQAPRTTAYAERWVGRELLDRVLIFGRGHPEMVMTEFIDHYNHPRPHQGIGQRRPCGPAEVLPLPTGRVERRDRLGGILHEYSRAA